jgi:hypothetical protein
MDGKNYKNIIEISLYVDEKIFHGGIQLMSLAILKCLNITALAAVRISTNDIGDRIAAL